MSDKIKLAVSVAVVCCLITLVAASGNSVQAQGRPFQALQAQVDSLQAQIDVLGEAGGTGGLLLAGGRVNGFFDVVYSSTTNVATTNEGLVAIPIPAAGHLTALAVSVFSNGLTGPAIFTVRVNGIDTPLQITVPAVTNGVQLLNSDVGVFAGDLVALGIDVSSVTGGIMSFTSSYQYVAD